MHKNVIRVSLKTWFSHTLLWLLIPIAGLIISSIVYPLASERYARPHLYTYSKLKASNGVKLYTLRTSPDNIELKAINKNLLETGFYGINGGFFYNGDLLSIAVMNDWPAKAAPNYYGSGWFNTDRARGTLVWDQAAKQFSIQVVERAAELKVTNRNLYWAQGGVSMGLSDDLAWEQHMLAEQMPAYDEERLRSAAAYDSEGNLWMIVTPTPCTIEQFRSAIIERIVPGRLIDGIFLDGDGSSQLVSRSAKLEGDGREVYQMLRIVK